MTILADDLVARVAARLHDYAGMELPAWVVEARARLRCEELGVSGESYCELIETPRGAGEMAALVEAVRVGETSFFRHRQQFRTLSDVIGPALAARGRRAVHVWSAGCASGQEAYSLAIVLVRALPDAQIQIVATDLSDAAIEDARANRYPREALDDVPEEYRDAFVTIDDDAVGVVEDVARLVRFERHNLVEPRRGDTENGRYDVVWCRNVLIYFSAEARKRAIDRLIAAAAFGGVIFVGYSESLRDIGGLEAVRDVRRGDAVYYMRRHPHDLIAAAAAAVRGSGERKAIGLRTPAIGLPAVMPLPEDAQFDEATTGRYARPATLMPMRALVALSGQPDAQALTAELAARLREHHARVVIDLDGAELLDDALAPILRRAAAAARVAGGEVVLRASRPGTQRWLARHGLPREDAA